MKTRTAIFIFSSNTAEEVQAKKLAGQHRLNIKLQNSLFKRTLKSVKAISQDYFVINQEKQEGESFHERFFNAYKSIFELGYEYVIGVGADIPNLNTKHLSQAIHAIETNGEIVIGPDTKGGVYLLGLNRDSFDQISQHQIEWCINKDLEQILAIASQRLISVKQLEALTDLDHQKDIFTLPFAVKKWVFSLFKPFKTYLLPPEYKIQVYTPSIVVTLISRGPPQGVDIP